jgi:hypothetical protein
VKEGAREENQEESNTWLASTAHPEWDGVEIAFDCTSRSV